MINNGTGIPYLHGPEEERRRGGAGLTPTAVSRDGATHLRIAVPVRKEGYRILLNTIWILILVATIAVVLTLWPTAQKGGLQTPLVKAPWLIAALLVLLGGLPLLYRLAWYLFGREEFEVQDGLLRVRRSLGRWGREKRFDLRDIRNLHVSRLRYSIVYPVWGRAFVAHGPYEVVFDYGVHAQHYVRGSEREEAEAVVAMIRGARDTGSDPSGPPDS